MNLTLVTWWWCEPPEAVEAGAPSLPGSEDSEESLMVLDKPQVLVMVAVNWLPLVWLISLLLHRRRVRHRSLTFSLKWVLHFYSSEAFEVNSVKISSSLLVKKSFSLKIVLTTVKGTLLDNRTLHPYANVQRHLNSSKSLTRSRTQAYWRNEGSTCVTGKGQGAFSQSFPYYPGNLPVEKVSIK